MPNLDLFLHNRLVGTVEPDGRDKTRVTLNVDKDYRDDTLLSESFATLPGRRPPTDAVIRGPSRFDDGDDDCNNRRSREYSRPLK